MDIKHYYDPRTMRHNATITEGDIQYSVYSRTEDGLCVKIAAAVKPIEAPVFYILEGVV